MIQDIDPHRFDNSFASRREPEERDPVLIFSNKGEVLAKETGGEIFPKAKDFPGSLTYLFSIDERAFFGRKWDIENTEALPEGFSMRSLKDMRSDSSIAPEYLFAAFSGAHLYNWYRDNRFCGRCGGKFSHSPEERALVCSCCGNTVYPRINPAVIVGVIKDNKILLTKYRQGYSHFALVAGFTEFGETLEDCVSREVFEETGLKVRDIRYYKSQPWGTAQDLLVGFFCNAEDDGVINMDRRELKLADWYSPEEIELPPDTVSLTAEMMKMFKEGKIQNGK